MIQDVQRIKVKSSDAKKIDQHGIVTERGLFIRDSQGVTHPLITKIQIIYLAYFLLM
jgi:hypothetical protein